MWMRTCEAKLARNYLDVPTLEKGVRQIVKISNVMRDLRPLAGQPNPPRYEPVTQTFDLDEARTYGTIKASRLVRVLQFLRGLKHRKGKRHAARRVLKMSNRLINGLDIYNRIKTLVGSLLDAVDAPETAIIPRRKKNPATPRSGYGFKWEMSPQKIYGWRKTVFVTGYDPHQTSVYWLEKQAVALRRAIYREHHGIKTARSVTAPKPKVARPETRTYVPPKDAQITEQIWPPIDLVRLIEERESTVGERSNNKTCHSAPLISRNHPDAEPRENLVMSLSVRTDGTSGSPKQAPDGHSSKEKPP